MVHQKTIKLDSARGKPNLLKASPHCITGCVTIKRSDVSHFDFEGLIQMSTISDVNSFRRSWVRKWLFLKCALSFSFITCWWTGLRQADLSKLKGCFEEPFFVRKWSEARNNGLKINGGIYIYIQQMHFFFNWSRQLPSRELTYPPKMAFWRWFSSSQGGRC